MTTPFEHYFAVHFQTSLKSVGDERVFSNGQKISEASWDRKAAFLLWHELGRPGEDSKLPKVGFVAPVVKPKVVKTPSPVAELTEDDWDIL